ncbi:MAG: efflux RND transporter periplasmic adaptor subunit [Pseudomonadota bacterium]|nr:efflux RND transporter periplasmic adaptor subunit [Pseudomonadota bacterium]
MTYRSILLPVGAALVFGGLLFVKSYGDKQMNALFDNMPQPPVAVSATRAQQGMWPQEIHAVGTFAAVNGADLATEAAGIVDEIRFKNGEDVNAGEVILRLDTDIDVAELNALQAAARLAELDLERVTSLSESNSISESELDAARSRADQARANVAAQRARIAQKTVVAPFAGKLGIRTVNLGQYVSAGSAVVSLQSLHPIFLNFMLPEQQLTDMAVGLEVQAKIDAFPSRTFMGKVTAIEPRVDQETRNFMVQAQIDNLDGYLRPGMFARVVLEYDKPREVLTVPQTAISFNPYGNSVYVIHKTKDARDQQSLDQGDVGAQATEMSPSLMVTQRFVHTGARRGDLIAVEQGLKAGERVATSGLLKLRNNAVVNINNEVRPESDLTPTPPES